MTMRRPATEASLLHFAGRAAHVVGLRLTRQNVPYTPNGNTEGTMNQLAMCRVPKDRILDRSAYEFFAARRSSGGAEWSGKIEDRGVVHTFPSGWVNKTIHPWAWQPSVVYYEPLGLYLMANWATGCTADGNGLESRVTSDSGLRRSPGAPGARSTKRISGTRQEIRTRVRTSLTSHRSGFPTTASRSGWPGVTSRTLTAKGPTMLLTFRRLRSGWTRAAEQLYEADLGFLAPLQRGSPGQLMQDVSIEMG